MSIRIIKAVEDGETAMYDSTSGQAFGPVAREVNLHAFQLWLDRTEGISDARRVQSGSLSTAWVKFCTDAAWVDPETGWLTEAAEAAVAEAAA